MNKKLLIAILFCLPFSVCSQISLSVNSSVGSHFFKESEYVNVDGLTVTTVNFGAELIAYRNLGYRIGIGLPVPLAYSKEVDQDLKHGFFEMGFGFGLFSKRRLQLPIYVGFTGLSFMKDDSPKFSASALSYYLEGGPKFYFTDRFALTGGFRISSGNVYKVDNQDLPDEDELKIKTRSFWVGFSIAINSKNLN